LLFSKFFFQTLFNNLFFIFLSDEFLLHAFSLFLFLLMKTFLFQSELFLFSFYQCKSFFLSLNFFCLSNKVVSIKIWCFNFFLFFLFLFLFWCITLFTKWSIKINLCRTLSSSHISLFLIPLLLCLTILLSGQFFRLFNIRWNLLNFFNLIKTLNWLYYTYLFWFFLINILFILFWVRNYFFNNLQSSFLL